MVADAALLVAAVDMKTELGAPEPLAGEAVLPKGAAVAPAAAFAPAAAPTNLEL